jgi:hypothetical protein
VINPTTVKKENLILRHSGGTTLTPTEVKDLGDGNYQYIIQNNWGETSNGTWEIWTSGSAPVLSSAGVGFTSRKIGEITVAVVGVSQILILVPWSSLFVNRIKSGSQLPPDTRDWDIYHQYSRDLNTWNQTSSIYWSSPDGLFAIEHSKRVIPLPLPTHSSAVPQGNDVYTTRLPGGAELTYSTVKQQYTHLLTFAVATYKQIRWVAYSDVSGVAEINGLNGASAISSDLTSYQQAIPFIPNAESLRFFLTKMDDTIVNYLIPRP